MHFDFEERSGYEVFIGSCELGICGTLRFGLALLESFEQRAIVRQLARPVLGLAPRLTDILVGTRGGGLGCRLCLPLPVTDLR